MAEIVNLTPHALNVHGEGGEVVTIPPSGNLARVTCSQEQVGSIEVEGVEIPLYQKTFGEVTGLPEPRDGVLYVVSGMVRGALSGRPDVWAPGGLLRDAEGRPVGCKGISA